MSNAALKLPPLMSVEEFLTWPGDGSGRTFELVDGEVRAQDPGSDAHGTIQSNLVQEIGAHVRATLPGCRVVTEPGVQPRLRSEWNFRVPDIGVTCAPNLKGVVMMPEPVLLVEVLSPRNSRDTWSNIPLYATLPSVMEVLIVHSAIVKAELLVRDPLTGWAANAAVFTGLAAVVPLGSVGLDLALTEVYRDTYLGAEAAT
jgi:Uma2 family endonuclease